MSGVDIASIQMRKGLIVKVSKAVKDKAGASNEYQHVLLELQALEKTLRHLQALQPNESNVDHVNAVRGMALTCRIPLQEFLERIQKYEASLGPFAAHSRGYLKSTGRKSQWAVFMSDEVAKLRTTIGAKVLSINLLLVTHTSESISRIEAEASKSHVALLASILEQRASIERLDKKVHRTESFLRDDFQRQSERTKKIADDMNNATQTLRQISDATETVNMTVMSLRTLAVQLLQTILRAPAFQAEDSVRFEDVLGRTKYLPYEYFRHIEVFDSYLQTQFKGLPGEQKVLQRRYLILHSGQNDNPITINAEWNLPQNEAQICSPPGGTQIDLQNHEGQHLRARAASSLAPTDQLLVCVIRSKTDPQQWTKKSHSFGKRPPNHLNKRSKNSEFSKEIDKSHFLAHDIHHVRDKFPKAPDYLVERLGKAISRRRQYLSYRENPHAQNPSFQDEPPDSAYFVGKTYSQRSTAATVVSLNQWEPLHMAHREDTTSQTSYAIFVDSHDLTPPLPEAADHDVPYVCPLCFRIISIRTMYKWRKHVLKDLHPYLCTVDGCDTADRIYQSRDTWFEHEEKNHYPGPSDDTSLSVT
ncbi:hypothetical protein N0V83_001235, partial [Neocucurbitaria cava]